MFLSLKLKTYKLTPFQEMLVRLMRVMVALSARHTGCGGTINTTVRLVRVMVALSALLTGCGGTINTTQQVNKGKGWSTQFNVFWK